MSQGIINNTTFQLAKSFMSLQTSKTAAFELYGLKNCDKKWTELYAKYLIDDLFNITLSQDSGTRNYRGVASGGGCSGTITYTDPKEVVQTITITLDDTPKDFCAKTGTASASHACISITDSRIPCDLKFGILSELPQEDVDCLQGKLTQDLLKKCF